MQISDLVGQYSRNVSQSVSVAAPAPGVQQLADTIGDLKAGYIFEGTVNQLRRGEVVLGLSNGQTVLAKIAGKIALTQGQSMFFQVKSNNGEQIEIRPYLRGSLSNPTLLKALDAAGIPASERNVRMVNAMMEEQMPIDKASLWEMTKTVSGHPDISVETLVQMNRLNLTITPEMAHQFESYQNEQSAITSQLDELMQGMPALLADENLTEEAAWNLNGRMLEILLGDRAGQETQQPVREEAPAQKQSVDVLVAAGETQEEAEVIRQQAEYPEGTLGRALNGQEAQKLEQRLLELPGLKENETLFENGKLKLDMPVKEFLLKLQNTLITDDFVQGASVKKLLTGKAYQHLVRSALQEQWYLKPQEELNKESVKELYHKLDNQMLRMELLLEQSGFKDSQPAKTAADIRGNMEFMNQINQAYQYLQLPLKLKGQNAHSDLYVYTNKRNLEEKEGELTAFLHLDLEHLGSTDVSVKMRGAKVHTDFYLADDASYDLVMQHTGILEERLRRKGYDCTIQVRNQEKKVDFVEDFLKKDLPPAGKLHRYSFDVRA